MLTAMRQSLKGLLLPETCTRLTASSDWATSSGFQCMVEEASATSGGTLDYEVGNGYGYSVYMPHDQTMETTDRIVANVGTIEVVRVTPIGTLDGVRRADCVKR